MKKAKAAARPNFPNTRKALRKQKRQQKKVHRQEHYLKKKNIQEQLNSVGRFVKRPADDVVPDSEVTKKKKKVQPSVQDILSKERQKEKNEVKRLNSQIEEQRRKTLVKANEDEDKVIKKLEKQLGLNKSKNKNNYFADDGLDYLLEICDRSTTEQIVAAEKHLADVEEDSDFEEDLAAVTGKEVPKKENTAVQNEENDNNDSDRGSDYSNDDEDMHDDTSGDDVEDVDSDESNLDSESNEEPEEKPVKLQKASEAKSKSKEVNNRQKKSNTIALKSAKDSKERIISEGNLNNVFSDDEVSHLSDDDLEMASADEIEVDDNDGMEEKITEKPDVWEDIYGRKRDKEGNVIKEEKGIYIPPHLRNKDSASDKELAQLKRQIKSILNKLAGTNLHWACTSIESLYSNNSRNSVNSSLTHLWLEATVGPSATPDRMVAEHAALVAVLHANVATEIGAHFLQELTKKFDEMLLTPQPVVDKTLDNLVSCLSYLYSFKIFHATLLYDILSRLTDVITEKTIDCVLVVLRSVGGVMRKEEPLALKDFIHKTQVTLGKLTDSAADGSRIKFLLEVLMAVKNNNLTKIPNYDPSYVDQLKKLSKAVIRKGNYVTPLNVRLEDLLKAEERGKWWIVGSAWEGTQRQEERPSGSGPAVAMNQELLDLARKQRMNTDVRRSIFCVIMSAEDYMDAFEKLQHLGLRGQQERETVHVVLACCLQERTFNPYYAVLAQQLCTADRKYQLSIQYTVWDKIKDLDNLTKQCISNLAQFLIHLIMEKALPLSVLKIIQFSDLNKSSLRFMRQILLAIIMNKDVQTSREVFHRISKPPKLRMFRESLRLFIQHFLVKNASKSEMLSGNEMVMLKERTLEIDRILTMCESKLNL